MRAATEMRRRIGTILATPPAENCGLTIRKRAQRGAVNLGCRAPKMCAFWRTLGDPAKCAKTRRVLAHVRQKLFNTAAPSRRKSRSESSHWRAILFRFTCASLAVCHGHARRGHDPSGMNPNMPASFGVANPRRRPPRAAGHCLAPAGLQTSASFGRPCRRGEGAKGRLGDKETRRQGDKETRRQGDKETRRQGDKETRLAAGLAPAVTFTPDRKQRLRTTTVREWATSTYDRSCIASERRAAQSVEKRRGAGVRWI